VVSPSGDTCLSILAIKGVSAARSIKGASAVRLDKYQTPALTGPLENCSRHENVFRNLVLCYFPKAINEA